MPTAQQIIEDIKKGKYYPVYFLYGEEPYYIDMISDFIEQNVLAESEKAFNLQIFYGKDTDPVTIIETARRFPMMASHQVIIVKEAQEMIKPKEFSEQQYAPRNGTKSKSSKTKKPPLVEYIDQPSPSTILVINYKYRKPDRRTKFYQTLSKSEHCLVFESKKLYDNQIPEWIINYASRKGLTIDYNTAMLLSEHIGNNLSNIVNELDKLVVSLPEKERRITPEYIEKYIGFSKDYNNIELQKAIIDKNILKANRIIFYFCKSNKEHPFILTISYLYYFFSKLLIYINLRKEPRAKIASALKIPEYFLKDYERAAHQFTFHQITGIVTLLREMDARAKGMGNTTATECDLLKELIFKILH